MKVLIIEDDESILNMLKRGLEDEDFVVDTAINGEDGEYLASTNHYDVIIVGAGIAGLFAAIHLPKDKKVLIINKRETFKCNSFASRCKFKSIL